MPALVCAADEARCRQVFIERQQPFIWGNNAVTSSARLIRAWLVAGVGAPTCMSQLLTRPSITRGGALASPGIIVLSPTCLHNEMKKSVRCESGVQAALSPVTARDNMSEPVHEHRARASTRHNQMVSGDFASGSRLTPVCEPATQLVVVAVLPLAASCFVARRSTSNGTNSRTRLWPNRSYACWTAAAT